tara:strand:- start:3064 stop:4140 length:1077 start_codon:yes stop_codon:yes gene_type:complete
MASFKLQVEALTGITIDSSATSPTEGQLTDFLVDGVLDVTNKVISLRPQEAESFSIMSAEQTSDGFNPGTSMIISVIRENGTNNEWVPCRKIPFDLQYKVTDVESLHYASKFNPAYMVSQNNNIHVFPVAGSNPDAFKVLYVNNAPKEAGDSSALEYDANDIKYFPDDKVHSVVLYASAMSCMAAAANIHQTLSTEATKPTPPGIPLFSDKETKLPTVPQYISPVLDFNLSAVNANLSNEDIEMSEKEMDKIEKKMDKFRAEQDNNQKIFTKELETFKSELDMLIKNSDRSIQVEVAEYKSNIEKYQMDTAQYSASLQEEMAQYKWYTDQYMTLMNQYNNSIIGGASKQAQPEQEGRR